MILEVYGKQNCKLCQSAKKKLNHLLGKWELLDNISIDFMDMETEYGAAESDFYDVFEIPSVLLRSEDERVIARWDGCAPPSDDLRERLGVPA